MNRFDGVQAFLTVARCQGFAKAARELGLPSSVVTKRIQWLEKTLGVDLFIRTTRQVHLTDAGEYLQQHFLPLMERWLEVEQTCVDYNASPHGSLSLAFAPGLAALPQFSAAIADFISHYPDIELSLTTVHAPVRLLENRVDILIATDGYVAEPASTQRVMLFPFHYGCYASRLYLEQLNQPLCLKTLATHRCLTYRDHTHWEFDGNKYPVGDRYSYDSGDSLLSACLQGVGLMYYPDFMLKEYDTDRLCQPVLTQYRTRANAVCLYYPQQKYMSRKNQVFIEAIKKALKFS
jgi:DNA-binding transcriptional LysR family regulator